MSKKDINSLISKSLALENSGIALPLKSAGKPPVRRQERKKASILLTCDDQNHIEEILDALYQNTGDRGSLSQALRIALELCPRDPKRIEKAFNIVRKKDKRIFG